MPSSRKKKAQSTAKAIVLRDQLPRAISSSGTVAAAVSVGALSRVLSFGAVPSYPGGCRIVGTTPWVTIGAETGTGRGLRTLSSTYSGSLPMTPLANYWLAPHVARLASCFTRYRFSKLRFDYHAMGSSASAVRMVFGYTVDPYAGSIATSPTHSDFNTFLTTPYSRAFSPWMDWSMPVPCAPEYSYVYMGSNTVAANIRQGYPGQIFCVADSDPAATYTYGVVCLSFVLDLLDPLPLTSAPDLGSEKASSDDEKSVGGGTSSVPRADATVSRSVTSDYVCVNAASQAVARR